MNVNISNEKLFDRSPYYGLTQLRHTIIHVESYCGTDVRHLINRGTTRWICLCRIIIHRNRGCVRQGRKELDGIMQSTLR